MNYEEHSTELKHTGYGGYVLIWLILMGLTVTTVAVAGIDLGKFILVTALLIAAVKSYFVVTIFMHIKFDDPVFKIFIGIALTILLSVFILTAFDVFYR
jgi:cytochrome c oxidase subunit IV